GIESTTMQRVAAEQSCNHARQPAKETISLNCLQGILRARWHKSTRRRQPRRDDNPIDLHSLICEGIGACQPHESTLSSCANSVRNSSNLLSSADRLGLTTTSIPRFEWINERRKISRIRLLIRFLLCAFPSLRGVVMPNLQ